MGIAIRCTTLRRLLVVIFVIAVVFNITSKSGENNDYLRSAPESSVEIARTSSPPTFSPLADSEPLQDTEADRAVSIIHTNTQTETATPEVASKLPSTQLDESYLPSLHCTRVHIETQLSDWCETYAGRHNIPDVLAILRYLLPNASTFVDVGANKGLLSARILELWRPQWNITSQYYARSFVIPYFESLKSQNLSVDTRPCGVTDMCKPAEVHDWMKQYGSSIVRDDYSSLSAAMTDEKEDAFVIHSIEPSPPIFDMHMVYQNNASMCSDVIRRHWKWHRLAASNVNGIVQFRAEIHEGGAISTGKGGGLVDVVSTTLDAVSGYGNSDLNNQDQEQGITNDHSMPDLLRKDIVIDVLKIDAENFDAQVVEGAAQLLSNHRIRVLFWETPSRFPVHMFGRNITTFAEMVDALDHFATMNCYFPGVEGRMIKVTGGCFTPELATASCSSRHCPHKACKVEHSNAMCVSRQAAAEVARAFETHAIVYRKNAVPE